VGSRTRPPALTWGLCGSRAVAVAPGGAWLATGGDDKSVRIWDVSIWQVSALMRLEKRVDACAWLTAETLAVGGLAGLYLFDFLADGQAMAQG
jgi:WD40 repeat protein